MRTEIKFLYLGSLLLVLLLSIIPLHNPDTVLASPGNLTWNIITTPNTEDDIILSPSEVNFIAAGADGKTIYAADISNRAGNKYIYRSPDNGSTWNEEPGTALLAKAGVSTPVWNIAIAPDDAKFIAAVTSVGGVPGEVYISEDGGANWVHMNLSSLLPAGEQVGSIDISPEYSNGWRDIAVGTRTMTGGGSVYIYQKTDTGGSWKRQNKDSTWVSADVIAIKFVPAYTDETIGVIVSTVAGTFLNLGQRDIGSNDTGWNAWGYTAPGEEVKPDGGTSPTAAQILTADLEMPSDFTPGDVSLRRLYLSYDDVLPTSDAGIYRREDAEDRFYLLLSEATTPSGYLHRFSSIAYDGDCESGVLLAGEVAADPTTGNGNLWITSNPQNNPPTWNIASKPPTGGFGSNLCNMQLAWGDTGNRAYCGTSSANLMGMGWPNGYTNSVSLDESAFSISHYSAAYEEIAAMFGKTSEALPGYIWNQTGLIDTEITQLTDVAALAVTETSDSDYPILYLASVNTGGADSVWRSVSEEPGYRWERILCNNTASDDIILRVYSGNSFISAVDRSEVLVFADRKSTNVKYSPDEGQSWQELRPYIPAYDIGLENDEIVYVASDTMIRQGTIEEAAWQWDSPVSTDLNAAHTVYVLPENAQGYSPEDPDRKERWVAVSDEYYSTVTICDFGENNPRFETLPALPLEGQVHVMLHDGFMQNRFIYAAVSDDPGMSGKLYRWTLGQSSQWLDLAPPDRAFFGLAMDKDVLYGLWRYPSPPEILPAGVDRTLYSTHTPPPNLEWDSLTYNLPATNTPLFTREPSSLKLSRNDDNALWAVDNRLYNWNTETGCLWAYIDTLAKRAPWPTTPPLDGLIPSDPKTGRADEINFQWLQLADAGVYELQVAKDSEFTLMVIEKSEITPSDQTAPSWILPAGSILETGHKYYWRIRVVGSIEGEKIHSPWSATMHFTVMAGLPVETTYYGPALLAPVDKCGCACGTPVAFSWSPYKETRKYRFQLSEDAEMNSTLVSTDVSGTAFKYDGKLKCNSVYYWRVRATEPFDSDWSATFSFKTGTEPSTATTQKAHKTNMAMPAIAIIAMIALIFLLFFFILILVVRTRHVPGGAPVWRFSRSYKATHDESRLAKYISGLKKRHTAERISHSTFESSSNATPKSISASHTGFISRIVMWWRRKRYLSGKGSKSKFFEKGK